MRTSYSVHAAWLALAVLALPVASAKPASPAAAGHTLTVGAATLWYDVHGGGAGVPLVVVNGGPGFDHAYLLASRVWDQLAARRPVVFFDQRGTGHSGPLKEGQSCLLADVVADLEALRVKLGADKIDLLGHSWGGYLSMAYAARHPDHVRRLILCDSAAPKFADTEFLFKSLYPDLSEHAGQLDFLDALGDAAAGRESLREVSGTLFLSPAKRKEFIAKFDEFQFARAVNSAISADLGRYDLWPLVARFKFPTLVLTGRFDVNVAPVTAWRIHKAIPDSRFHAFEQSGHMPFFEEPEEFGRVVEEFLRAN